ncbi:MAG: nitroreductase family deazaflavin-dependent oxidoreductase [Acidimicrobiia bacterium]|nr:nitroreductase family deazaflavin-dependent oxidoreductase [Acidimicrobiia bacterium]
MLSHDALSRRLVDVGGGEPLANADVRLPALVVVVVIRLEVPHSVPSVAVDAAASFCYLTTTGRRTGQPHTIEIWFAVQGGRLYLMSGGREKADWVRNIQAQASITVRIGDKELAGNARVVQAGTDEDALARRLLLGKYEPPGSDELKSWGRSALPVAIDLEEPA